MNHYQHLQEQIDYEYQMIQKVIPKSKIAKYKKSVIEGFYNVYFENGQIVYVNPFKNLILYMTRCLAKSLDINKIYAVSNKGYYANNHIRIDRKLKTSLNEFWEETGGKITIDYRFYELPVEEYRKSIDEIKTHKRSQYRNRFKKLDEVEAKIIETVRNFRL